MTSTWDAIAGRATERLNAHDPVLAELVSAVAGQSPENAAHHGNRARLDAYLAMMAAQTAETNATAADKIAQHLVRATWALVIATLGLLVVTVIVAI